MIEHNAGHVPAGFMTNHVQFLVADDPASISNTMKVVGSQYACYVNRVYRRTGTLWEG